jgi:hypothetical protein
MNLLMLAPLYDNKGSVRYYVGCQVDVTHLVEGGNGLESFERLLADDRADERYGGRASRRPAHVLGDLGQMMNDDELDAPTKSIARYYPHWLRPQYRTR